MFKTTFENCSLTTVRIYLSGRFADTAVRPESVADELWKRCGGRLYV